MKYVASRVAPMGKVGPGVATATFYNFAPRLIEAALPAAWEIATPSEVYEARVRGVDAAMTRWLGADVIASPEMAEAAELAATVARSIPGVDGRALFAGYTDQPWPEAPHLVFWHALTLLREYRGDGHVAALQGAGLSGLDALVTHTASRIGFSAEFAKANRGWTTDEWDEAETALRAEADQPCRRTDRRRIRSARTGRGSHRRSRSRAVGCGRGGDGREAARPRSAVARHARRRWTTPRQDVRTAFR